MKDYLLEDGDIFIDSDEMYTYSWSPIPAQWIGLKVDYKAKTTFGRHKIPVRRASKETGNTAAIALINDDKFSHLFGERSRYREELIKALQPPGLYGVAQQVKDALVTNDVPTQIKHCDYCTGHCGANDMSNCIQNNYKDFIKRA